MHFSFQYFLVVFCFHLIAKMIIFQWILHFLQKHYQRTDGPTDKYSCGASYAASKKDIVHLHGILSVLKFSPWYFVFINDQLQSNILHFTGDYSDISCSTPLTAPRARPSYSSIPHAKNCFTSSYLITVDQHRLVDSCKNKCKRENGHHFITQNSQISLGYS